MATRSLGTLTVDLVARIFGFEQGMDKAAKTLDAKIQSIKRAAGQLGAVIGVAAAAAGTALAVMVKQSIDAMDGMSDLAQSTGNTVAELSSFAYIADIDGVSAESFSAALVKLTKSMSDTAQGTGEAQKGFAALGISVKNVDGTLKSNLTVLNEVATKFAGYRDGAEKTALAVNIFGRSGADLIPILNRGADGINELREEAERLGIAFSDEASNAAGDFNDTLTRLNAVKKGLANRIAQQLLPTLVNLSQKFLTGAQSAERLDTVARVAATGVKLLTSAGIIVAGVFKTVGEAIGGVAAAVVQLVSGNFKGAFETVQNFQLDVVANIAGTIRSVQAVWDDTANDIAADAPETADKIAAPVIQAEEKVKKSGKKIVDEAERIYKKVEEAIARIQRDIDTFGMSDEQIELYDLEKMGATAEQLARAADRLGTRRGQRDEKRGQEVLDDLNMEIEALGKSNEWLAKREALLRAGTTAETEMGQAILKTVDDLYRQGEAIDFQIGVMDTFRMEASNALADVVTGTKSLKDGFLDMMDAINKRIMQMIAEKWIEQLFGQMGTNSSGSAGGWFSMLAGMFSGAGHVGGGTVQPFSAVPVNEAGIEMATVRGRDYLLTGNAPAQVTPHNRVPLGGGGMTVNFNGYGRPDRRTAQQAAADVAVAANSSLARNGRGGRG